MAEAAQPYKSGSNQAPAFSPEIKRALEDAQRVQKTPSIWPHSGTGNTWLDSSTAGLGVRYLTSSGNCMTYSGEQIMSSTTNQTGKE